MEWGFESLVAEVLGKGVRLEDRGRGDRLRYTPQARALSFEVGLQRKSKRLDNLQVFTGPLIGLRTKLKFLAWTQRAF